MAKDKSEKTNVMRTLDQKKVAYKSYTYGDGETALSGVEVAAELGLNVNQVFKTLVTFGAKTKQNYVFIVPVAKELDLKKAAKSVDEKSVEL
ncbi:MAG: YbaK/EbsC family protein, partial [Bacillota bacterium]|nr:YbaK/EbsC family protein [Bacillota bacterium]